MTGHIIEPYLFPHVSISERSARPGVDGPRYTPIADNRLGDTNTGLTVYPQGEQQAPSSIPASSEMSYREVPLIR